MTVAVDIHRYEYKRLRPVLTLDMRRGVLTTQQLISRGVCMLMMEPSFFQ